MIRGLQTRCPLLRVMEEDTITIIAAGMAWHLKSQDAHASPQTEENDDLCRSDPPRLTDGIVVLFCTPKCVRCSRVFARHRKWRVRYASCDLTHYIATFSTHSKV